MYRVSWIVVVILSLAVTKFIPEVISAEVYGLPREDINQEYPPSYSEEEYHRQIHSMVNAYRSDMLGGRLVIETNSLIDTKFRTWKRNADMINTLLALPLGMNDAGR